MSRALTALIIATVAPLDACAWLWRQLTTDPACVWANVTGEDET